MDWTWHVGDIVLTVVGGCITVVLIPLARTLIEMRDTLKLIAPKVIEMETKVDRHHEWLILLRGKNGSTP